MVYAAFALALVLIWRSTRIVNFAQAPMAMITTFVALTVIDAGYSYWLGFAAALLSGLVLGAVVQIFQDFQYHRTFVAGSHDVALEFSARVDRFDLKGLDLIRFDADGRMVEFEVLVRPFKALEALNAAMTARIGPELARLKQAGAPA